MSARRGGGKGSARGPGRQSAGHASGGPQKPRGGGRPDKGGGGHGRPEKGGGGHGRPEKGAGGFGRADKAGGHGRADKAAGGYGRPDKPGGPDKAGGRARPDRAAGAGSGRPAGGGRGRTDKPGGPGRPDKAGRPERPSARGPAFSTEPRPGGGAPPPDIAPTARMIVYGIHPVEEALRGRRKVHKIWATEPGSWGGSKVTILTAEEIAEKAGSDAHQGVCALVDPYPYADANALLEVRNPFLIALDEITDPQNLGAIARTAEGVGATGVIIPERRAAEVTPAVCKASAGAVEHVPIARVKNLADFLVLAKEQGCWVYGASAGAKTRYDQPDYTGGVVAVLGAEGKGLRTRVASMCDDLISLPLRGRIESLNVSATAAVVLYEMLQQRLDAST